MWRLSWPEMFGFITKKALEGLGFLNTRVHRHRHLWLRNVTQALISAALLCWHWTKWSMALYMGRTSSHSSQTLAFIESTRFVQNKCWLIFTSPISAVQFTGLLFRVTSLVPLQCFSLKTFFVFVSCISLSILSCYSPQLWSHFLWLCPGGDHFGIHQHGPCGIMLNLHWFTHRAINNNNNNLKKTCWQACQWSTAGMPDSQS